MPLTLPCTACEGSGISRSLQSNWLSDDCDICRGSGEIQPLWGRKRFVYEVLNEGRHYVTDSPGYAEHGYELKENQIGILFANWNAKQEYDSVTQTSVVTDDFMPRFSKVAERAGFECEWSDEWCTCSNDQCNKAFRTQADSHGWTPSYAEVNDEYLCIDCIKKDYIEEYLEKQVASKKGITIGLDDEVLEALGWAKVNTDSEFESGWHPGQNDDPDKINKNLQAGGFTKYLFVLDRVGQFDISFSVWTRTKRVEEVREFLATGSVSLRTLARSARARRKQQRKQKSFER